LEGCKPSKNRSFSPQQGDAVALLRRKEEIFGGGKPPLKIFSFSPPCCGEKERFLEGLQPSKPPAWLAIA